MSPTRKGRPVADALADALDRLPLPLARSPIPLVQGSFYVLTGLWPVLGIGSFERVTGPKTERWLVKSVGLLTAVIGAVLLLPPERGSERGTSLLGMGSAAALGGIDAVYLAKGVLGPAYLLDATFQLAFLAGWAVGRPRRSR